MYTDRDAYRVPLYSVRQVAQLTGLPPATVHTWTKPGDRPLIQLTQPGAGLSFINLVEVHVLAAIRRGHNVPLPNVRAALEYVRQKTGTAHPLVDQDFETDGCDLFVRQLDVLINATRGGQTAIRELLEAFLNRIERAPDGFPKCLFPVYWKTKETAQEVTEAPRWIAVDPQLAFGRPVLLSTGIPVDVIVSRYRVGDSVEELAADYRTDHLYIQEALRYELAA
mgnify:CR=1 FL=1